MEEMFEECDLIVLLSWETSVSLHCLFKVLSFFLWPPDLTTLSQGHDGDTDCPIHHSGLGNFNKGDFSTRDVRNVCICVFLSYGRIKKTVERERPLIRILVCNYSIGSLCL